MRKQIMKRIAGMVVVGLLIAVCGVADEPQAEAKKAGDASREQLFQKFTEQMNGVKLVGRFTIVGRDNGPLAKYEYTIQKVEKLPDGDKWLIHARIKYGTHDLTL